MNTASARIAERLGKAPIELTPLHGGCVAEVYRATMPSGRVLAIKVDTGSDPKLDREAHMLSVLAEARVPVPAVVSSSPDVLAMEYIENDGRQTDAGERELAHILASLHAHTAERYGLDRDTLIGPLDQPNAQDDNWLRFFAEQRITPFADEAQRRGSLPAGTRAQLDELCSQLHCFITKPCAPSLIHGDLWAGNVLWNAGRPAALIDPAVYYADPEIELAFIDLMGGVGRGFWDAYNEIRPIDDGFWHGRCQLYQLYPLLVHAILFGSGYGSQVRTTADRLLRSIS
ncbi:MAG: fructosamine kinase family protein [Planctomycetota bacterium]